MKKYTMNELELVIERTLEELIKRYDIYLELTNRVNTALSNDDLASLDEIFLDRNKIVIEIEDIYNIFIPVEEYFKERLNKKKPTWDEIIKQFDEEKLNIEFNKLKEIMEKIKLLEDENSNTIKKNAKNIEKQVQNMRKKYKGIKNYNEFKLKSKATGIKAHFIDKKA